MLETQSKRFVQAVNSFVYNVKNYAKWRDWQRMEKQTCDLIFLVFLEKKKNVHTP